MPTPEQIAATQRLQAEAMAADAAWRGELGAHPGLGVPAPCVLPREIRQDRPNVGLGMEMAPEPVAEMVSSYDPGPPLAVPGQAVYGPAPLPYQADAGVAGTFRPEGAWPLPPGRVDGGPLVLSPDLRPRAARADSPPRVPLLARIFGRKRR